MPRYKFPRRLPSIRAVRLIALWVFIHTSPAIAQPRFDSAVGIGALSCGEYMKASSNPNVHQQYRQWVLGFISGVSIYAPSKAPSRDRVLDNDAAMAFVDEYCRDFPPTQRVVQGLVGWIEGVGGRLISR